MHHVGGYYDLYGETQVVEEDDEVIRGFEEWVETQAVDDLEEVRVLADDGVDRVQVAMFEKKGCTWSVPTSRPLVEGRRRFWWKMGEWVPQRMATMASPWSLHGGDPPRKAHGSGLIPHLLIKILFFGFQFCFIMAWKLMVGRNKKHNGRSRRVDSPG
ncbi:transcription factor ABORTED MICROSPORES [Iris pallida]|uniref:Transcription factor ABORTED MICROSPORES n=1 Tax=Iris pallida TaxID=29817 RepID=A0AAX6FNB6_IRIPA|nr:transcription factor ABORTED MICROSPORES [Iris pallida]